MFILSSLLQIYNLCKYKFSMFRHIENYTRKENLFKGQKWNEIDFFFVLRCFVYIRRGKSATCHGKTILYYYHFSLSPSVYHFKSIKITPQSSKKKECEPDKHIIGAWVSVCVCCVVRSGFWIESIHNLMVLD